MNTGALFALSPVIAAQALWVMARASRLPEAEGPRQGIQGTGPELRLLILGDSSAAGVGVTEQKDGLAGQLVARLAQEHRVTWSLHARSGAVTREGLRNLEGLDPTHVDLLVTAFGVNDVKNAVPLNRWTREMVQIISHAQTQFGAPLICVSEVPPLGEFPLLPHPLRNVLGARADRFNARLRTVLNGIPGTHAIDMHFPTDPDLMAEDGFHPSAELYGLWAQRIVDATKAHLS